MNARRVALVVQRFGAEVNGGAELHARMLAKALGARVEIDVLTSCARDHTDWAPYYPPGESVVDGLRVRRFANPPRNDEGRAKVPLRHKLRFLLRGLWPTPRVARPAGDPLTDGERFLRLQGPHCPELLATLARERDRYDAAIFFTALYETTALGIQAWGRHSLLVPLLHDEKASYLPVFHRVLRAAGWILFNTRAEQQLARALYGDDAARGEVCGSGVDVTPPSAAALAAARDKFDLGARPYVLYLGRIETGKGCAELVRAFQVVGADDLGALLVLAGREAMPLPDHAHLRRTGFVGDAERDALIAGAAALVVPSRHESLSLVLLEALSLGTPVIVNGRSPVLADHVQDSQAGIAYRSARELRAALRRLLNLPANERALWARRGREYVQNRYAWPAIVDKFVAAIERVSAPRREDAAG